MNQRDFRNIFVSGLALLGIGAYGLVYYAIRRREFHRAVKEWTQRFPVHVKALRAELLQEEGISE